MAEEIKPNPYWSLFTDNGKELVYDKEFSRRIGIIEGVDGISITKDHFAEKLQIDCLHKFNDEYFQSSGGDAHDFLDKTYARLKRLLKKEIKTMTFLMTEDWKSEIDRNWFEINAEIVKHALLLSLFTEYYRISAILDDNETDFGYDWKPIVHDIKYPDETIEEWRERERREKKEQAKRMEEMRRIAEKESQ